MKIKTEEELWGILGNLDKYNAHIEAVINHTLQQCMLSIPAIVIHHLKNEQEYKKIKLGFFKKNPELEKYKPVVGKQLQILSAANPSWSVEKVFQEVGLRSKEIIRSAKEGDNYGQKI
jgi:hypothetical protein